MTSDTTNQPAGPGIARRRLLGGAAALAAGGAAFAVGGTNAAAASIPRTDSPVGIIPIPRQVPAVEGFAPVPGGRVWYWDTGGSGTPIIFMHPFSGSFEVWPYQQPYFAKAGFRVIAYSRRGHYKSDPPPADNPGTGTEDLHAFANHLGLGRFHLAGVAAGGGVGLDYALSHENRLRSLVISGSVTGVQDQDYVDTLNRLLPPGIETQPEDFLELGPSYRAINPGGAAAWMEIYRRARTTSVRQRNVNSPFFSDVERLRVPTLLLWGDGDLHSPPSVQRIFASHLRNVETAVANECGHAPQWERSDVYNPVLLMFLRKHSH